MDQLDNAQKQGVVLGLKNVAGVVPRLDIDVLLFTEPEVFNLFLLAFEDLKTDKDIMGYFEIAGIHGIPKREWNEIGRDKEMEGSGYCTHSMATFPTWHRSYLAMIEQSIYWRMTRIAEKFPDKVKQMYRDKVSKFRLPYWDYFRPRAKRETKFPGITLPSGKTSFPYDFSIPRIFTEAKVMIRTPEKNKLVLRENPLFSFSFPEKDGISPEDWEVLDNKEKPENNFAAPVKACDSCGHQEEQAHVVTDTAPITPILKDYVRIGELQSLAPEHVEPFLIKKLKWRVVTVNGDRENTRSVRQLTLKVTSVFTPGPESAGPPLFKEYKDIIPKIISIEGKLLKWTKIFRRLRKQSKL